MSEKVLNRDISVDILRGIAIIIMIAAHAAAGALVEPHPFWFRVYSSFAAPIFILLAGMMVAYTANLKGYKIMHFITKALMLLAVGILIDVLIWQIYPCTTVDVLYPIAVSLPLVYLAGKLKTSWQIAIIATIFLLTPILQHLLGYTDYPIEIYLSGELADEVANQTNILNHWLIDGWFPLFPWLGFSLLGQVFFKLRKRLESFADKKLLFGGGIIFIVGCISWAFFPGKFLSRAGYSELFYPPTIGYILTAIGVVTILFYLIDLKPGLAVYKPLQVVGESSLFFYVLHFIIIEYVLIPLELDNTLGMFLMSYAVFSAFIILAAYGLRNLKTRFKMKNPVVKFIIGG